MFNNINIQSIEPLLKRYLFLPNVTMRPHRQATRRQPTSTPNTTTTINTTPFPLLPLKPILKTSFFIELLIACYGMFKLNQRNIAGNMIGPWKVQKSSGISSALLYSILHFIWIITWLIFKVLHHRQRMRTRP